MIETRGRLKNISVTKSVAAAENYAAEDIISESATDGTVWTFTDAARTQGSGGYITKAQVFCETTGQVQRLSLYLFTSDAVTCEVDDNKAFDGVVHADIGYYIGRIDFPAMDDFGGDSETTCTPSTTGNLPLSFICESDSKDIYGVLITRDAFTNETATDDYIVRLTVEQF